MMWRILSIWQEATLRTLKLRLRRRVWLTLRLTLQSGRHAGVVVLCCDMQPCFTVLNYAASIFTTNWWPYTFAAHFCSCGEAHQRGRQWFWKRLGKAESPCARGAPEKVSLRTLWTLQVLRTCQNHSFLRMYIRQPWAGCLIPLASHETHGVSFIEESDAMFFSSIYEVLHTQLLNSRRFDGRISRRYGLQ